NALSFGFLFAQTGVHLITVTQIAGDDRVNIHQWDGGKAAVDLFCCIARIMTNHNRRQRHPRNADADNPILKGPQRHINCGRWHTHDSTSYNLWLMAKIAEKLLVKEKHS